VNFIFPIVLLKKVLHLKYFRRESKYNWIILKNL
jgi:hypothetical protein